jgi:hypothetical protein
MDEAQWEVFLQRLLDASRTAIGRFAAQHPADEVCYFAFDAEPRYGYVLICCNTSHANLRHDLAEVKFPEWQAFAESDGYPKAADDDGDYLQDRIARLFARALVTLAEDASFSTLRLASPTLLGFGYHDCQLIVHMLNLPAPGGTGVA